MAVKSKLSILMGVKRCNMQDVHNQTGLARTSISLLYHDKAARIDFETINRLCTMFECRIEDLLEYTKD